MPLPQAQKRYTYQDYITWPDDERWEIIDGVAYNMSPAPTFEHQHCALNFATLLRIALKGKPCTPGMAPTDVLFTEENVVQPDVFVVCDLKKITREKIFGAPDLIIEVLSPSTEIKDRREKKRLYEAYGVREYVLVNVEGKFVERFIFNDDGAYSPGEIVTETETLKLHSLDGLEIVLSDIFDFPQ